MGTAEPQNLVEVLANLERSAQARTEGEEQRRHRRFAIRADARLEPIDQTAFEETATILLRNVSQGGLGFLVDRPLDGGTMWRVRFLLSGVLYGSQPLVVRYCQRVQENLYVAGGEFVLEPFILTGLGVSPAQLEKEAIEGPEGPGRFVGPHDELPSC